MALRSSFPLQTGRQCCSSWMGRVKGTIQPVQSGVLVDKSEGPVACFGEYAPQDAVRAWGSAKAAKQLNFEAEDMPFVSALNCWSQALQDCSLLVFIDNDAARHAWVSASAFDSACSQYDPSWLGVKVQSECGRVLCRVPTHSNSSGRTIKNGFQPV